MALGDGLSTISTILGCHMVSNRLWIVTEYLGGGSLPMAKTKRLLYQKKRYEAS